MNVKMSHLSFYWVKIYTKKNKKTKPAVFASNIQYVLIVEHK